MCNNCETCKNSDCNCSKGKCDCIVCISKKTVKILLVLLIIIFIIYLFYVLLIKKNSYLKKSIKGCMSGG